MISGEEGVITPEKLIELAPQNIIATGGEWGDQKLKDTAKTSYVHLGYKADEESAKQSLAQLKDEPGLDQLQAFTDGRVFGVYHQTIWGWGLMACGPGPRVCNLVDHSDC